MAGNIRPPRTKKEHNEWCWQMLATHVKYPQYGGNKDRDRGRELCLCHCSHCEWVGDVWDLTPYTNSGSQLVPKSLRRPEGYCPECGQRPFGAALTENQYLLLLK